MFLRSWRNAIRQRPREPVAAETMYQRMCLFLWVGGGVGCLGFNGPLRQYFSLYRAISQREGERGEKGLMRVKIFKQLAPAPTASAVRPRPTIIQIVGRPDTGSLPRTIAPSDHPLGGRE